MPVERHELAGLNYSIRKSGDGYEVLDAQGKVVAWTMDKHSALKILLGLELLNDAAWPIEILTDLHNYLHHDDDNDT